MAGICRISSTKSFEISSPSRRLPLRNRRREFAQARAIFAERSEEAPASCPRARREGWTTSANSHATYCGNSRLWVKHRTELCLLTNDAGKFSGEIRVRRLPDIMSSDSRPQNCFDLLRLLFAGMVLYVHAHLIGGFEGDWLGSMTRGQVGLGDVGVLGFFSVSGFLIAASYARSESAMTFLRKRVLRIFPGFYANLVLTALVFGPLICLAATGSLSAYPWTGPDGALHYLVANAGLKINAWHIGAPPNPDALNGSLWSLWPEFICYLGLLVMGACGALRERRVYLLLLTGALYGFFALSHVLSAPPWPTIPTFVALGPTRYALAFGVGACFWSFRDHLPPDGRIAVLLGASLVALAKFGGWDLALPILFPLFILHLAHSFRVRLRHDLSYGIYIYHFPVAKLLVCFPFLTGSFPLFLAAVIALTLPLAMLSWIFVERRFLGRAADAESKKACA